MAEALAKASGIAKVHYRSLASHPQHELARRQMLGGYGRLKACVWPSCLGRMPSAREAALLTAATSGSAARTIGTSLKTISPHLGLRQRFCGYRNCGRGATACSKPAWAALSAGWIAMVHDHVAGPRDDDH